VCRVFARFRAPLHIVDYIMRAGVTGGCKENLLRRL
jgi:hypothetical protein